LSADTLEEVEGLLRARKTLREMTPAEIDQFLACARVGRVGIVLDDGPYVVPVGYGYRDGEIFFHTCYRGLKMEGMRKNPGVCFEADESLSDVSMYRSVIARGTVEVIDDPEEMRPYLQGLIDKYRAPVSFDEYMGRPGRDLEREMAVVRICVIKPREITGRAMIRIDRQRLE